MSRWDDLRKKYPHDDVQLLSIYSRERHPQEPGYPDFYHTKTDEERMEYGKKWADRCEIPVAVDGVDEKTLKAYGRVPNAAFVVDRNGILVFKSQWADHRKVEVVIDKLLEYEKRMS